ncbi:MAG: DSD1 family PLP-dependent enzyme [Bryobacterales bacterium]|nr:DSD1 family PLP-dependent enzyme [Bryobacteraceae bacterium]MDW8354382.1 DSD1 family PLP-dependent enzyme [Bryobacterales bacterium]
MTSRRVFLTGALAAPFVRRSAAKTGYSFAEIERMLERGDIRGRLSKDDLPTPALLLDLDAFEANVAKMARYLKERHRGFRPHGKTHKCSEIAKYLIRAGANGACAAKLSEAEVFARDGVSGILITTPVVGRHKIPRAVRLATRHPDTIFSVDNAANVHDLNDAAAAAKIQLNLAVDLWIGRRTGVPPGEPALGLARLIESLPNVRLAGIQAYSGPASHTVGFENRKRVSEEAMLQAVETRWLFEKHGIPCPLLSGGSTGTYNIDSEIEGVTELQPGSFIFMDLDYNRIGGRDGGEFRDFANSLTVLTTVISRPADDIAIVDGGLKAFSTDKPFVPVAKNLEGVTYSWAGDEHGRLDLSGPARSLKLGDRVEFIVPHCDPSVNLYDRIFCLRGERVETAWKITARGMSQ